MLTNRDWQLIMLAVLVASASAGAQEPTQITVQYESAQLRRVVENFATFSGRAIVVASGIDDQLVTANVRDVAWNVALDQILESRSLVARPQKGGALQIERERKLTVDYHAAPLSSVLQAIAGFSGRTIAPPAVVGDPWVTVSIRDTDWQRALDQIAKSVGLVARADRDGVFHLEQLP
jgi:type II secretory pathway component HofQ